MHCSHFGDKEELQLYLKFVAAVQLGGYNRGFVNQ